MEGIFGLSLDPRKYILYHVGDCYGCMRTFPKNGIEQGQNAQY